MNNGSIDEVRKYYEEQLSSQRGMLSSAIDSLAKKRVELEEALVEVNKRNYELSQISHRTFHDMKEPMVSLLGLVRIIREESNTDSVKYLTNLAEASVKRLNDFSLSLSDYVTVIQKKPVFELIDLDKLLEHLVASLKDIEGFKKVRFEVVNRSSGTKIRHDKDVILAILKNPVMNAIRFRDVDKDPYVSLEFKVHQDRIMLAIRDNGMGMSENIQKKVTHMFYRGSNHSGGQGLGLYMTKMLLEKYQGKYRISSREGCGTTIFLSLYLIH